MRLQDSILLPASVESGRAIDPASGHPDFGIDQISGERLQIDIDAQSHAIRRPDLAISVALEVLQRQLMGERLQRTGYSQMRWLPRPA